MSRSDSILWLQRLVVGDCVRQRDNDRLFLVYETHGDNARVVNLTPVVRLSGWLVNGKELHEIGQLKQGDQMHTLEDPGEDFHTVTHMEVEENRAFATLTKTITPDNHEGNWTLVSHVTGRQSFYL